LQILLLAQHVSGTTMPIIRSSRVLYSDFCLWYLVLWFSSCWSGVELRVMCLVCRMLQHPASWLVKGATVHKNSQKIIMYSYIISKTEPDLISTFASACNNKHSLTLSTPL